MYIYLGLMAELINAPKLTMNGSDFGSEREVASNVDGLYPRV
jgi:hypothetical protein